MTEDEKLIEVVAQEISLEADYDYDSMARSAIAAVRKHDAEAGMVTVPREPTDEMLDAGMDVFPRKVPSEDPQRPYHFVEKNALSSPGIVWDAMIERAIE